MAQLSSFDIVSQLDLQEVDNAVNQAKKELQTRFDFKGSGAQYDLKDGVITLSGQNEFQLQQMLDILRPRLAKIPGSIPKRSSRLFLIGQRLQDGGPQRSRWALISVF